MRCLAAFLCALALPVAALDGPVMTPETCRAGWKAFSQMTSQTGAMTAVRPFITDDGWCRVDDRNAKLTPKDFGSLEWRGTGVDVAVFQEGFPTSLEVRIEGTNLAQGFGLELPENLQDAVGDVQLSMSRDASTRDFAIHDLTADFGDLGALTVMAKGGGIDLGSAKSMQFTLGGLRVYSVDVILETTSPLSAALFKHLPSGEAVALIEELSETTVARMVKSEFLEFLRAGPTADGRLTISARSQSGVGFVQIAGGGLAMDRADSKTDALADATELMLTGVTIDGKWGPND